MEGRNGTGPAGLDEVIRSVEALVAAKQAEVDEAKAVFDGLNAELRQLNAMLKAARPEQKAVEPKRRQQGVRYGEEELRIVLKRLESMRDLVEDIPGSFGTATVMALGYDSGQAQRIVNAMREREMIRLVGERRIGTGARPSNIFVIDHE